MIDFTRVGDAESSLVGTVYRPDRRLIELDFFGDPTRKKDLSPQRKEPRY